MIVSLRCAWQREGETARRVSEREGRQLGERRPVSLVQRAEDRIRDLGYGGARVLHEGLAAPREDGVRGAGVVAVGFALDDAAPLERGQETCDPRRREGH